MAWRSYKELELHFMEHEKQSLRSILVNIDSNTYDIVYGYAIDTQQQSSSILLNQMPLDINLIYLITSYIGTHFEKANVTESNKRIMDFIANTDETLIEPDNPWIDYNQCCSQRDTVLICWCCCFCCCCLSPYPCIILNEW